jgi:hypothetical protein
MKLRNKERERLSRESSDKQHSSSETDEDKNRVWRGRQQRGKRGGAAGVDGEGRGIGDQNLNLFVER